MKEILLLKDGEIVLKGLNRRSFEDVLKKNLKHALRSAGRFEITSAQSTIYVKPSKRFRKPFQGLHHHQAVLHKLWTVPMMMQTLKRLAKSFRGCSELSLFQELLFVKKQSNPFLKPPRNILKISLTILKPSRLRQREATKNFRSNLPKFAERSAVKFFQSFRISRL